MNEVAAYFGDVADKYSNRSDRGIWRHQRRREARALLRMVGNLPLCAQILDLGCGAGFYLREFKRRGYTHLTGVDLSQEMLDQMDIPGCTKVFHDIEFFSADESYDLILCAGALEFATQPRRVFANVKTMLNSQGTFALLFPLEGAGGKLYQRFHARHDVKVRLFSFNEIAELAHAADLRILDTIKLWPFSGLARLGGRKNDTNG